MPCLAFGAGRRRRRRRRRRGLRLWLLPGHLPCVLPPSLHRRTILSGTAPGRHFLEGTAGPWDSGEGKARFTRNNGVLPIPVFCFGGRSKGFPSGGRRRQDGVFSFFERIASKARILHHHQPFVYPALRPYSLSPFLTNHWFSTNPPCKTVVSNDCHGRL